MARLACLVAAVLLGGRPRCLASPASGGAPSQTDERGAAFPELTPVQLAQVVDALLAHPDEAVREAAGVAVLQVQQTALGTPSTTFPEYGYTRAGYPYVLFALQVASVMLFVITWEAMWLQSSLKPDRSCWRRLWERVFQLGGPAKQEDTTDGSTSSSGSASGERSDEESVAEEPAKLAIWDRPQIEQFWKALAEVPGAALEEDEVEHDEVYFAKSEFIGMVGSTARIQVHRRGAALQPLTVLVKTHEAITSFYAARAGEDFQAVEEEIRFEARQVCQVFEVELPRRRAAWAPTTWFRVELAAVVSGSARIGGPTASIEHQGPVARVYILQDASFPPGAPEHLWSEEPRGWELMTRYLRMQRRARGAKWTKTLVGLLYAPVHGVVVTALIKTWMLDWAANKRHGPRNYDNIMVFVCLYIVSTALERWGDQSQTKNRGRTGGIRQGHRRELFCKGMMLEHVEHCKVPAEQWFYVALQNVDCITIDGYWQCFMLLQSLFALVLSLAVIFYQAIHNNEADVNGRALSMAFLILVLLVPFAAWLTVQRRPRMEFLLEQRMEEEAMWVDTWAWLVNAGSQLFSFGPREKARVEASFAEESKSFVNWHQQARDHLNDTVWIIRWATAAVYALILGHGGVALLRGTLSPGQFVLTLSVTGSYSSYLEKAFESVMLLQRANVSLVRLCRLLNLQEHQSLQEGLQRGPQESWEGGPQSALGRRTSQDTLQIELRGVQLDIPRGYDLGPLSAMRLRAREALSIPLGTVVRIRGGSEGLQYSFMALVAGVVPPTRGSVDCPGDHSAVMMAMTPMRSSHLTVLEALMLNGAGREVAENLARALGLNADRDTSALAPGELQALTLVRELLRDPDILVASRPLSYVKRGFRAHLVRLLRAWQVGGARAFLKVADRVAAGRDGAAGWSPASAAGGSSPSRFGGDGCVWRRGRRRRTLVITDEDLGLEAEADGGDLFLDLDEVLEEVASPDSGVRADDRTFPRAAQTLFDGGASSCSLQRWRTGLRRPSPAARAPVGLGEFGGEAFFLRPIGE